MEKESILHGQGRLCRYSRQLKLNSERIREAPNKRNSIGVSRLSKIPKDASIPFQINPWEYEMKNSDEKVNIGAFREVKSSIYAGGITHLYVNNNRNESSNPTLYSTR